MTDQMLHTPVSYTHLQGFLDVVTKNRAQLFPQTEAAEEAAASAGQAAESAEEPQITNISASDEDAQEE